MNLSISIISLLLLLQLNDGTTTFVCHGFPLSSPLLSQQQQLYLNHDLHNIMTDRSIFHPRTTTSRLFFAAAKGFGSGTAASSNKNNKNKNKKQSSSSSSSQPSTKAIAKQLTKTYGGTTPEQIARGTQQIMNQRMKQLSPSLQLALQLYQNLQQWKFRVQGMTVLEQSTKLNPQDVQGANRAQQELDKLLNDEGLTMTDLHNLLQVMTWDASADAKAARSITGRMPRDIQQRLEKASAIVASAVNGDDTTDDNGSNSSSRNGRCLDVGCGFGVMVPFLQKAGIASNQIYGIDLSPEMIRNAKNLHPDVNFYAGDFFSYQPPPPSSSSSSSSSSPSSSLLFDSIVFCSSLHDLPNVMGALEKAISLLRPIGGKLVILHAQGGASHVLNQVKSNPVLVPRGLPTVAELQKLQGVKLVIEPAAPKSKEESRDGYLAVLETYVEEE